MTKLIQPLSTMVPIVDDDGKPTAQFARTLQRLAVSSNLSVTNGKIDVAAIATHMILANKTAGSATPTACSISDILDFLTTTRGSILFRGASGWQALGPGTALQVLQTNGPGADPTWVTPSAGGSGWPAATVPGQIGGLVGWWDASLLSMPTGGIVPVLNSPDPLRIVNPASNTAGNSAIVVATSQINSRNAATFPLASTGSLICQTAQLLNKSTAFVVHKPGAMANTISYTYFSGLNSSLTFRLIGSAANVAKFELVKAQVASIGQSTVTVPTGTAFQGNYTYDGSTGAYAFRIAKATAGSGTNIQAITANSTNLGVETTGLASPLNGDLAELIMYSRVLTGAEISAVEVYLTTKWGV